MLEQEDLGFRLKDGAACDAPVLKALASIRAIKTENLGVVEGPEWRAVTRQLSRRRPPACGR
jgi:hypothetical protein